MVTASLVVLSAVTWTSMPVLLAEAFTRPSVMYRLAKIGFTQSYTYFAWKNSKAELVEFVRVPDANRGYLLLDWVTMGQILSTPEGGGPIAAIMKRALNRLPPARVTPAWDWTIPSSMRILFSQLRQSLGSGATINPSNDPHLSTE